MRLRAKWPRCSGLSPSRRFFLSGPLRAEFYSHPAWLVRRWLALFGAESTHALLAWNQRPAPVFARWCPEGSHPAPAPDWLKATPWPGFFEVPSGRWADVGPLLRSGQVYLQDPATRIPIQTPRPQAGKGRALMFAPHRAGRVADLRRDGRRGRPCGVARSSGADGSAG